MRVLMLEDNKACAGALGGVLEDEGFVVDHVATLNCATDAIAVAQYDAMIIDRLLPDGDGLDWVRTQRREGSTVPILIATAECDAIDHRVEGLNAGADDYLLKPIPLDELVARLRAVLRRPTTTLNPILSAGNVTFDPAIREVRVAGRLLKVPRRETCLLEMLIRRPGKTVTKRTLEEGLYSFESDVSSNAIEVGIYRLRGHLMGAGATVSIRTLRGTGYAFEGPNEPIHIPEAPSAPEMPRAAIVAAQVASAMMSEGVSDGSALPGAEAARLSGSTDEMGVAVLAAALATRMSRTDEGH